jgi:putative peptidoglycan lipid II flippase
MLPLVVLLVGLSGPVAKILFQRGEFGSEDVEVVASLLPFLGISILLLGFFTVTNRLFYAHSDTVSVFKMAVAATALYWVTTPALVSVFGYVGLGLGFLLHAIALVALQLAALRRRAFNPFVRGQGLGERFIKTALAGLVMAAALVVFRAAALGDLSRASSIQLWGGVAAASGLAAGIYLGAARLLRVEELPKAVSTAKDLFARRRR